MIGQKFGRLTVKNGAPRDRYNLRHWFCVCDCGQEKAVGEAALKSGKTKSCGCLHRETSRTQGLANRTHGKTGTKVYRAWRNMIRRCCNPRDKNFPDYGGRGIFVCERWLVSFENFYEDMGEPGVGLSLERIKVNGSYVPENCKWATSSEQQKNRRKFSALTKFSNDELISEMRRRKLWIS